MLTATEHAPDTSYLDGTMLTATEHAPDTSYLDGTILTATEHELDTSRLDKLKSWIAACILHQRMHGATLLPCTSQLVFYVSATFFVLMQVPSSSTCRSHVYV